MEFLVVICRALPCVYLTAFVAAAAHADLDIPLETRPTAPAPQAAPKRQPAPLPAAPAPKPLSQPCPPALQVAPSRPPSVIRGVLASRSMPRQIGVMRRGRPPILPPAGGASAIASAPNPPAAFPSVPAPTPAAAVPVEARLGRMLASATDVYRLPDVRSQWVGKAKRDQQVAIVSQWQGWFAIIMSDGSQAYVPQTHVEVLPFQVKSVTPTPPPAPPAPEVVQQPEAPSGLAQAVIAEAYRYEGTPYVYGGNTQSGIDCSGLVKNCFAALGVSLPRRASQQVEVGQPVALNQLQPGDRLYFSVRKEYDHTGIYLGDGYFIHAGRSRGKVGVDHLSTSLYNKSLSAARRL